MHWMAWDLTFVRPNAGRSSSAARMAMMGMTTSSSISVKPAGARGLFRSTERGRRIFVLILIQGYASYRTENGKAQARWAAEQGKTGRRNPASPEADGSSCV